MFYERFQIKFVVLGKEITEKLFTIIYIYISEANKLDIDYFKLDIQSYIRNKLSLKIL